MPPTISSSSASVTSVSAGSVSGWAVASVIWAMVSPPLQGVAGMRDRGRGRGGACGRPVGGRGGAVAVQLRGDQRGVPAAAREQVGVGAVLSELAVMQDQDQVGVADGAEPVGDQD